MPPTPPRRKRRHPARAARRLAGWLSVAAMVGLTGGMTAANRAKTSTPTQSTTSSVAASSSGDDLSASQRASIANALAGSASSQSVTVSHAS